jgi:cytochrome b
MNPQETAFKMQKKQSIKVWNIAVCIFHWTLVECFTITFISSEDSHNLKETFKERKKKEEDEFWEEVHKTSAYFTRFLVSIHIMGVLVSGLVHRQNLIKAMITGRQQPI